METVTPGVGMPCTLCVVTHVTGTTLAEEPPAGSPAGSAVVSYRDGKDNPIWVVELDEPDEGKDTIGWRPITWPDLPAVDLFDATRSDERGAGGSSS